MEKESSKDTLFLLKISTNLHMSFAIMTRLAEGPYLDALLTLKVENSLIYLEDTRLPSVSVMELQFILPFKT
jgi:hypothetical protein